MIYFIYFLGAGYLLSLLFITIYCLMQFSLLYHYKRPLPQRKPTLAPENESIPFVTIQLPIFNERYVLNRLVDNIIKLDYPRQYFEIHILDDSTDDTINFTREKVKEYQKQGFQIEVYHRQDRQGFKAGALRDALPHAKGDYIAIFDADFLPNPNFLKATLPYFNDANVGVVQTRWEHINQEYSMLTRLQAMQLNVHFRVEQKGREKGNFLLQFNGTAGIWRRDTIYDAGGWEADTLTEDLDLSYRAQLKGWKILFLEEVGSPAELPSEMNGLKSQQFRWMKGGAENARKFLPTVWRSSLSLSQKIHATTHLMGSSVFLFIFTAAVLSVPLMFYLQFLPVGSTFYSFTLTGLLAVILVYYTANVQAETTKGKRLPTAIKFVFLFPLFLALSMGMSLHNSVAVIQGLIGKKTPFIRTPKFNIQNLTDEFRKRAYFKGTFNWMTIGEGFLAVYFFMAVALGFFTNNLSFFVFHLLLGVGFGTIFLYSVRHLSTK